MPNEAPNKKQAAYVLPRSLVKEIKNEATEREVKPCVIVELACRQFLDREGKAHRRSREAASA